MIVAGTGVATATTRSLLDPEKMRTMAVRQAESRRRFRLPNKDSRHVERGLRAGLALVILSAALVLVAGFGLAVFLNGL
jgi:hypothetical protein